MTEVRATFLALPLPVQAAMRAAGATERWSGEFWTEEVGLVVEMLMDSGHSPAFADELTALYRAIAQGADHGSKTA